MLQLSCIAIEFNRGQLSCQMFEANFKLTVNLYQKLKPDSSFVFEVDVEILGVFSLPKEDLMALSLVFLFLCL